MTESDQAPFLKFLREGIAKGGFETDDVLSALLPLFKQTQTVHEAGMVAPLDGIERLSLTPEGHFMFAAEEGRPPERNSDRVEALQMPLSRAVEVVGELRHTADIDAAELTISDLSVDGASSEGEMTKPVFLPSYRSWEQAIAHHDQLTDIFSLGMLLGSVACGLDFTDAGELEVFTRNRGNLFAVNRRLNPVIASVIVQMTELNRHKRAPDLAEIISRLKNYREQAAELDFKRLDGFEKSGLSGKRQMIQAHLRDRLFEISRRNRLIYFKPTLGTLNLTVASVPLLLDYRNIKLEQLFVWHPELASTISEGAPMSLGKYLRFEDAPYIPGVLDKVISEARRDRTEYGFAQLRLVLCFLRWHNLKEAPNERIHSPLLLLPVELTKKKGVRDSYVLAPTSSEAEVNPALRHHLRELYNLVLPEFIDLKNTSLDQFCGTLRTQIRASEPGVTLNKVDRPQIELIHEKARQRVDQYRRRIKLQAGKARSTAKPEYSYDRDQYRPLGLQLFLEKVRPSPMPMRDAAGAPPEVRMPHMVEAAEPGSDKMFETERQTFSLREGESQNPYSWDFDLCSLTLGNFNYRKMTLVSDYAKLIETDMGSAAFDSVFQLSPKPVEEVPPPLGLAEQNLIISCDAAQASAISRARTGASYIIQGPPGTGKSQTITNLIADYVARGKRVLFVCEKRAAIDVVFHRLRRQGLDELCCLIHDSQSDKKGFIQNLKQTYEQFLSQADLDLDAEKNCEQVLRGMEQDLASLRHFSEVMRQAQANTGVPVRSLLHRLVELRGYTRSRARELPPEMEEMLPDYPMWLKYGEVIDRLKNALTEVGEDLCFARHPLRWLSNDVLRADRPIEMLSSLLDKADDLIDSVENALALSGLPGELWNTLEEIQAILEFAVRARPLAERGMIEVLTVGPALSSFEKLAGELDTKSKVFAEAEQKNGAWKERLGPDDTENALALAKAIENSIIRFARPTFWRLRKTLEIRYDFTQHAVPPPWSKILTDLAAEHEAKAALVQARERARREWQTEDAEAFRSLVGELRGDELMAHPSVMGVIKQLSGASDATALVQNLAEIHERFEQLDATLRTLLMDQVELNFAKLGEIIGKLRGQTGLFAELSPILSELVDLPEEFGRALRRCEVPLNEFEGAIGHKSLNQVYRQDRAVSRFEGRVLARKVDQLEKKYCDWLALNARRIRTAVRRNFLDHVHLSSQSATQLEAEQKAFKKSYSAGRRDLEHEFGKTMRYKSIRDLAAGETGQVIQDLKPIWLMSPLSVSDTLPLEPNLFDVVIFDEASQIPLEEAIPALYRSQQVIIVGDEMQLPPTTFFATSRGEDGTVTVEEEGERVEVDLDSDSFLTQAAQSLPSTLLAWHYRSRYESLISFSNAAFYGGNLYTIPDRQQVLDNQAELNVTAAEQGETNVEALLARSLSFHFMEKSVYEDRTNPNEAAYIAHLVRGLFRSGNGLSIGIVAFSEAQQNEIENALSGLADEDSDFSTRLEAEYVREDNDVFSGLFVKNLENVQGDERDIIIMSVCYGHDGEGRMLMNFGPINQRGGEKRLNVIFSRAKYHMAIVSSIRDDEITNDYNDGANSLKQFLQYAEAVSKGDAISARRVLENLNPLARKALAPLAKGDAVVESLAMALRERGHSVDLNVGQSKFRCDLAVRSAEKGLYQLGILVDTEGHYANPNLLDHYLMQPSILRAFGWRVMMVLTKDWYHHPEEVLARIEKVLRGTETPDLVEEKEEEEGTVEPGTPSPTQKTTSFGPQKIPPTGKKDSRGASGEGSATEPIAKPAKGTRARRFEFVGGSSQKFWEISMLDGSFTVKYGRIGTAGQSQTKTFPDSKKAKIEAERLIAEKVKKGYTETR